MHIYIYIARPQSKFETSWGVKPLPTWPSYVGLYTILPSPILYGVWHTKGGSVGGVYCEMGVQ